ncbi:hypothetical protein ACG3SL_12705 [Sphingomonas sp. CJ20]
MRTTVFLVAGAMFLTPAMVPAAHAQLAEISGDVEQRSDVSTMAAVALGPNSRATIVSSSVQEGAEVDGSVYQRSSGGLRVAVAAGAASRASIAESTICGQVHGDARQSSNIRTAASVSLLPGGGSRISSASAGPGHQGSVSLFVSAGTVVATDFNPWGRSTIILGSTNRGC